jgi:hypothetical protein
MVFTPSTGGGNRVQAAQGAGAAAPGKDDKDNKDKKDDNANKDNKDSAAAGDGSAADRALADQMRLMTMSQAANGDNKGSYIPRAAVAWGVVGIVVASVLFTVVTNRRTRRLEQSVEDF